MSNFNLPHIPSRAEKPRTNGVTMMMDKGLSWRQAENFIDSCGDWTDIVKLGFGTSYLAKDLERKLAIYKEAGLKTYFGGTLFEAFIARGQFDEYRKLLTKFGMEMVEVSDGSIHIEHDIKLEYIRKLTDEFTVLSEVGSKEEGILISPGKWISMMNSELEAGSWMVIAEARESGNVGIYRPNKTAHVSLVNKILANVPSEKILWEAPLKAQQVWFIKLLGADVNLGNISHDDVIPLETLRIGLRGDTFFTFLPEELQKEFGDTSSIF